MKFLIAGATGRVGRHLVEQLHQAGHDVRALTRNAAKAKFPAGVEVVQGDLTQPETLTAALEGVTGLHLITFGGDYGAPLETGPEIMALAEKAGVQRVTVLLGGQLGPLEAAVQAGNLDWTFLQPVEFMSNMLDWVQSVRAESIVRVPYADRKTAIVHDADIAAVGVSVLINGGHVGEILPITGPEVLTPRQMAHIISQATELNIGFTELTEAEARAQWSAAGFPPEVIEFFVWAHGNTPEIGYTVVPTVEQVTGRPARRFAQWAAENAATFCG
jgi:uncharacterized protein YbjT (DUF2867 family)